MPYKDQPPFLDVLNKLLDDAHALDITIIDVRKQTTITDFMIVCSGRSTRHVKAIAEQIMVGMKTADLPALHHSGLDGSEWALIDFGDCIVHVMQPDCRAFYNLEALWQDSH